MKLTEENVALVAGILGLAIPSGSVMLYAFAGVSIWSDIPPNGEGFFRAVLLVAVHIALFIGGIGAMIEFVERKNKK